jgi:ankyrin repeat protein
MANQVCGTGDIEKVKSIVNETPYVVAAANDEGDIGLHIAAREENEALIRFLVDSGTSVQATNQWGETPLDTARQWNFYAILEILQRAAQNSDVVDRSREQDPNLVV